MPSVPRPDGEALELPYKNLGKGAIDGERNFRLPKLERNDLSYSSIAVKRYCD